MAHHLVALAGLFLSVVSQAGVLQCTFTEPFFTVVYDSATGKVTRISPQDSDRRKSPRHQVIATKAKLERDASADDSTAFVLRSDGAIVLSLHLDGQGNDGMSENFFPFRANYKHQEGACDTRKYPRWNFDDLIEDLHTPG